MDTYFQGKVAVITGAAGVICSQIAKDLASIGVKVALVGRTVETLQRVETEINAAGGVAKAYPCDVTDEKAVEALAEKLRAKGNNANMSELLSMDESRRKIIASVEEMKAERTGSISGVSSCRTRLRHWARKRIWVAMMPSKYTAAWNRICFLA